MKLDRVSKRKTYPTDASHVVIFPSRDVSIAHLRPHPVRPVANFRPLLRASLVSFLVTPVYLSLSSCLLASPNTRPRVFSLTRTGEVVF
eukprot:6213472-Pleurochrysis_carterae.AAC.7